MLLANAPGLFYSNISVVVTRLIVPLAFPHLMLLAFNFQAFNQLGSPPPPTPQLESPVQQQSHPAAGLAHSSTEVQSW